MNKLTGLPSLPTEDAQPEPQDAFRRLLPWQSLLIAFLSGLLLTLAFPPTKIGWVAFLALAPLLSLFPFKRSRTSFLHGAVFGLAYFCGLLYWIEVFASSKIGGFGVAAWFILSAREACWIGIFALCVNFVWTRTDGLLRIVSVASFWTIVEWARQLGALGFGWGGLAYSQWQFTPILTIASVTGTWGISWLIVAFNTAVVSRSVKLIAAVIALIGVAVGVSHLCHLPEHNPRYVCAAALQANILEDVPYTGNRPADPNYFYGTLRTFDQMVGVAKQRYGASVCVTAETSVPGYPSVDPELRQILSGIAVKHQVTLIVGARAIDTASQDDTNSVFVFLPDGSMSAPYNKQQLVPWGEYVPYRQQIPFLNNFHVLDYDMHPGSPDQPPMSTGDGGKAGVSVCYESTYPRFMREQVRRGATFDVVVTDDAWYGRTAAAEQHMAMSVLRAAETDRYLVRCASTGISTIISPTGKILSSAPLFVKTIVAGRIEQRHDLTPFVRFGDWWIAVCALIVVGALWPNILKGIQKQDLLGDR